MATLSATGRLRRKTRPASGRSSRPEDQTQISAGQSVTDTFLRHSFTPLLEQHPQMPKQKKMEQGFFESRSTLCREKGLIPIDVSCHVYPYNIVCAFADLQQQIGGSREQQLLLIAHDDGTVRIALQETYDTRLSLYYIPVLPLFNYLRNKRHKRCGALLLSVFSYLYRVAGIPYYRDDSSYLYYTYDMIREWLIEGEEEYEADEYRSCLSELSQAAFVGDHMLCRISHLSHLDQFTARVSRCRPGSQLERDCLQVAKDCLDLWQTYPNRTVFDQVTQPFEDEDEWDHIIRADQYIGFIADTEPNWLYNNVSEFINTDFQERGVIENPNRLTIYGESCSKATGSLEYDKRLLHLLDDLCTLLYALT